MIGIHGLLNKPPRDTLETWWKAAIDEGLDRNADRQAEYEFELVYWADVRNPEPIDLTELDEPYVPATGSGPLPAYAPGPLGRAREIAQKWGGRVLDWEKEFSGLGRNVEALIGMKVDDLEAYYENEETRRTIRDRLGDALHRHTGSSTLLVAHSMGSIIAYDVLRELEAEAGLVVDHLVTIGSPLGLPYVAYKVREEFGETVTPAIVRRWTNIADARDKVSIDSQLGDEYKANGSGVAVQDSLIVNGYISPAGAANTHKSYGYLRAPEFTELVTASLDA